VARVLLIDDDRTLLDVLAMAFEEAGHAVIRAEDGRAGLAAAEGERPDVIVSDVNMPGLDGFQLCRALRAKGDPVALILLTSRDNEIDEALGLDLGADDYVAKPFSPREVVSRVRAVLRRTATVEERPATIEAGDLRVDLERREVLKAGAPIKLTRKEFDLLAYMAAQPGVTFSRTRLLEDVWDFAWDGDSATVTVHVRRLREKIEDTPSDPTHLVTVWGVGYRFDP
jgi:DNA-binding response OmpR family regulator